MKQVEVMQPINSLYICMCVSIYYKSVICLFTKEHVRPNPMQNTANLTFIFLKAEYIILVILFFYFIYFFYCY